MVGFSFFFKLLSTIPKDVMAEPKITDWITAVAALFGIAPIIWGLVKLFIRDRYKDMLLKYYGEQLNEIKSQTAEYRRHTVKMQESNELLQRQIDWQILVHDQNKDAEAKKNEIDEIRRKNEIRPYFEIKGAGTSTTSFRVSLKNKGRKSNNIRIDSIETDKVTIFKLPEDLNKETDEILEINGQSNTRTPNNNQVECEIRIQYLDIDGNKYFQNISKTGIGFVIGQPYED